MAIFTDFCLIWTKTQVCPHYIFLSVFCFNITNLILYCFGLAAQGLWVHKYQSWICYAFYGQNRGPGAAYCASKQNKAWLDFRMQHFVHCQALKQHIVHCLPISDWNKCLVPGAFSLLISAAAGQAQAGTLHSCCDCLLHSDSFADIHHQQIITSLMLETISGTECVVLL